MVNWKALFGFIAICFGAMVIFMYAGELMKWILLQFVSLWGYNTVFSPVSSFATTGLFILALCIVMGKHTTLNDFGRKFVRGLFIIIPISLIAPLFTYDALSNESVERKRIWGTHKTEIANIKYAEPTGQRMGKKRQGRTSAIEYRIVTHDGDSFKLWVKPDAVDLLGK
jgi:uncharacterized membrane protein YfhO